MTSPGAARHLPPLRARVLRAAAAALVAVAPVLFLDPAGAQTDPAAVGIGGATVLGAQQAMGVVNTDDDTSLGWVAAPGVVVTTDRWADEVGVPSTFSRFGDQRSYSCYTAVRQREHHLAVLRCAKLGGAQLAIATAYPPTGTPVFTTVINGGRTATEGSIEAGVVTANDVMFMRDNHLQFSFLVSSSDVRADGAVIAFLRPEAIAGAPVIDAQGRVVSTLLTAPNNGGQPIGLPPGDVAKAVAVALPLPESFTSAAAIKVGRRAVIPAAVGIVVGIVLGLLARNGTVFIKAVGFGVLGIIGALAYSAFLVMVVGPQTLLA